MGQHLGLPAPSGLRLLADSAECSARAVLGMSLYRVGWLSAGVVIVGCGRGRVWFEPLDNGATYAGLALCDALEFLAGCGVQVLNFAATGTTAASGLIGSAVALRWGLVWGGVALPTWSPFLRALAPCRCFFAAGVSSRLGPASLCVHGLHHSDVGTVT
jgi:hypothetical protein